MVSSIYHKLGSPVFRLIGLGALAIVLLTPTAASAAAPDRAVIRGFPAVRQSYSLSCEYAAAAAITLYWGNVVSQNTFLREVPQSPNPHLGFRGDIFGPFGGINDYGVYAEPLVPVLEAHGYQADVYYGDLARLKATLRSGNPVLIWFTTGRDITRTVYTRTYQGAQFKLVPGEHAVAVYGFDGGGVYMMDVGNGGYYYTDWSSFLRRWNYLDEMMLVITPATQ
jgi:uncharacterized protein YvpB